MTAEFTKSDGHSLPMVSVLMPVRNEGKFIVDALQAVLSQDYPADRMEVIVADGMSDDKTPDVVRALQAQHVNLVLIDNPGQIVPTGMNAALRIAKGEIIVRVDGHCEPAGDYVRQCVRYLEEEGVDGVGGPIETVGESFIAKAIAAAMSSRFGVGGSAFRTVKNRAMLVDTIAFPAYTREAIRNTGLYDEQLVRNQDDEYNYRLTALGGTLLLTPHIRSRYFSRASLRSLWKQYFQYGFWKVRVMQKHPRQMRWRQFVPPTFVAALTFSTILAGWTSWGRVSLAIVAGSYLAAVLVASVWIARRLGWRYLMPLPIIMAALHLSYGFGFLSGLVRFWRGWKDRAGQVPVLLPKT